MIPAQPSPNDLREPLPEVGAVLHLDTQLSGPDYAGGKHWKLAGSCVLLEPDRILTIGHILGARMQRDAGSRHYAVFFPYAGLVELSTSDEGLTWEDQRTLGDNLALVRLAHPVEHCSPVAHKKIDSLEKYRGSALVCGYGSWRGSPFDRLEGIQQWHEVSLGPPRQRSDVEGWRHYDNLDLSWSAAETGVIACRGNSGGPMLWRENGSRHVVGIVREVKQDQQVGSWIGHDRTEWLSDSLRPPEKSPTPLERMAWRPLSISAGSVERLRFEVPLGTTRLRATLNGSQGMRLQMAVVAASAADDLAGLPGEDRASGQFLCRTASGLEEKTEIVVGLCTVAAAPPRAERALAQLCVAFE